jgi:LDH2 family malate/lactate/ureidoglycolate dehydrogenase
MDIFGDSAALKNHVRGIMQHIADGAKAEGQDRIYIHGEKEALARAKSMRDGITLDDATCKLLESLSREENC